MKKSHCFYTILTLSTTSKGDEACVMCPNIGNSLMCSTMVQEVAYFLIIYVRVAFLPRAKTENYRKPPHTIHTYSLCLVHIHTSYIVTVNHSSNNCYCEVCTIKYKWRCSAIRSSDKYYVFIYRKVLMVL